MSPVLFKETGYPVSKLLADIDNGEIALPELQRPFVWKPPRVRDLFDSMYRGYPVGRRLMARVVRAGFDRLVSGAAPEDGATRVDTETLIALEENQYLEKKSSARYSLTKQGKDQDIELGVVKSVAGFMNAAGGTLLIGVDDEKHVVGLAHDFALISNGDPDRFEGWLAGLLEHAIGKPELAFVSISVDSIDDQCVCRVVADLLPPGRFARCAHFHSLRHSPERPRVLPTMMFFARLGA